MNIIQEVRSLNDRYNKILGKSKKLMEAVDGHAEQIAEHLENIRRLLGIDNLICSICCKDRVSHCVDTCHHCFCQGCARRCMRDRCMICRQPVTSVYKIFLPTTN